MAQDRQKLIEILRAQPVMPVVAVSSPAEAVDLSRALVAGGIRAIEITLRTPAAIDAIRTVVDEVPEIVCGAGTVLGPKQFEAVEAAGAKFVVSPGATMEILDIARDSSVPLLPGAATPSELMAMIEEGYSVLKFFPAEQSGGAAYLKSLAPVFPEIVFCPTGGVSMANVRSYLSLPNVVCVGGSWIAPKEAIAAGRFEEVTRLAAEAAGLRSST